MKIPRAVRRFHLRGTGWFVRSVALVCIVGACTPHGPAQTPSVSSDRVDTLRRQIEQVTNNPANDERLGKLWLQLANLYRERFQAAEAEQAYGQALSLLRSSAAQAAYADALGGLGSIYDGTGRQAEAISCLQKRRRSSRLWATMPAERRRRYALPSRCSREGKTATANCNRLRPLQSWKPCRNLTSTN
jgi:tetratricopeptide (TPR) repeat protein